MELISEQYRKIQAEMHKDKDNYGTSSKRYVNYVMQISRDLGTTDILDYGCGKGALQQNVPFSIKQYDPAIKVHSLEPEPSDIVVCGDVLEHVEPEYLDNVLKHLANLTKVTAFLVIHGNPAKKTLPDGRNAHLIIEEGDWWFAKISQYFTINSYTRNFEGSQQEYIMLAMPKKGESHGNE